MMALKGYYRQSTHNHSASSSTANRHTDTACMHSARHWQRRFLDSGIARFGKIPHRQWHQAHLLQPRRRSHLDELPRLPRTHSKRVV